MTWSRRSKPSKRSRPVD